MTMTETTNESDVKLRECPFCGDNPYTLKPTHFFPDGTPQIAYFCENCNFELGEFRWNHRSTDHLLKMAAEALQLSLDDADGCELNMSNYHHDDVHSLNDAYVRLFQGIEQTLLTLQQHGYGKE